MVEESSQQYCFRMGVHNLHRSGVWLVVASGTALDSIYSLGIVGGRDDKM